MPCFGQLRVAEIARSDVRRWFDSMSGTPGNANRTLPVLSVMMRQAELWDLRPQGSNPCRNMRRYKTTPREGRFVFPNRKGDGPMTDLSLRWQRLRDLAGLDSVRIHDCRHTWASQGVMNGVGLTTVGRLLGHRQRETTAIYAHLDDGALRDAAAQAAAGIARAMGFRGLSRRRCRKTRTTSETRGNSISRTLSTGEPRRPIRLTLPRRRSRADVWNGWIRKVAQESLPNARTSTGWVELANSV